MTDDILFIPDFADYRLMEVEKGAQVIKQLLHDKISPDQCAGAMKMLRAIINMPTDNAKTKEAKEQAEMLRAKMLAQFEATLIRKCIVEEE